MADKPSLNLILRGHVRSSFNDRKLFDLVAEISDRFETKIYAHTWNVVQNSISWREMAEVSEPVGEYAVRAYLSGFNVRWVSVDNDGEIKHVGNTEGKIGRTPCPILGWKNMYWGLLKASGMVRNSEPPGSVTVQTRFDLLSNPFSPSPQEVLEFLLREYEAVAAGGGDERIRFLRMHCFLGVDNIYMATADDVFRFVSYMYYDMDRILHFHRGTIFQEHISFHERRSFVGWNIPGEPVQ